MEKPVRLILLALLVPLTACASMASLLGVETVAGTDEKVKIIHQALDPLGPWGSLAASGVAALLVGANHAYRNHTRGKTIKPLIEKSKIQPEPMK